jgi:hypothetical protein
MIVDTRTAFVFATGVLLASTMVAPTAKADSFTLSFTNTVH